MCSSGTLAYLECEPEIDQEGMIQHGKDFDLLQDVPDSVSLQTHRFVHVLHRVHLLRVTLLDDTHLGMRDSQFFLNK